MGWTDKAIKKASIEKVANEILNSKEYQMSRKKELEEASMKTYCKFVLVTCDFLQMKHNYKKKGIEHFLTYAKKVMEYSLEDTKYFEDINDVMIDECGVDVLELLGVKL